MTQTQTLESAMKRAKRGLKMILTHGHLFNIDLSKVDLNRLNLNEPLACVLAQAHPSGDYRQAAEDLNELDLDRKGYANWQTRYGFNGSTLASDYARDCRELKDAWYILLTQVRTIMGVNGTKVTEPAPVREPQLPTYVPVNDTSRSVLAGAISDAVMTVDKTANPEMAAIATLTKHLPFETWNEFVGQVLTNVNDALIAARR